MDRSTLPIWDDLSRLHKKAIFFSSKNIRMADNHQKVAELRKALKEMRREILPPISKMKKSELVEHKEKLEAMRPASKIVDPPKKLGRHRNDAVPLGRGKASGSEKKEEGK